MTIEIRNITEADLAPAVEAISTAFHERPDIGRVAEQLKRHWERDRTWVAVDGGTVCGTFRSYGTEITLPGLQRLPAAAVAAVSVLPTHRRRGILTRLAATEHRAVRERGEVFALLYASEFPIYGRFGYGPGTRTATWTIDTTRTGMVGRDDGGHVELVRPDEAIRDEVRGLYDRCRRRQPGEIRRRDFTWDYALGLAEDAWDGRFSGWLAVHRDAGGAIDGFLRYKAEERWEAAFSRTQLFVRDLFALTEGAHQALWTHLLSADLVASVKIDGRTPSDRLPWRLANPRAAAVSEVRDGLWVRVFDVPRALAARTYERSGSVVLEIVDEAAAGGRWRVALDASPDGATCASTDRSPELTIPVAALGSIYLGGPDLRDVVLRTGVDEHRDGALAETTGLFRTRDEPWCSTFF